MIIAGNCSENTRFLSFFSINITGICSTIVAIVALNIVINTSYVRETISTVARVSVFADDMSIDTTGIGIARISSTSIVIVTRNW